MPVLFDATTVDPTTGEILETRPNIPFRSATDDKAYDGREKNSGERRIDASGYITIQEMEARCRRGDFAPYYAHPYDEDAEHLVDDDYVEDDDVLLEVQDRSLRTMEQVEKIRQELDQMKKEKESVRSDASDAKQSEASE